MRRGAKHSLFSWLLCLLLGCSNNREGLPTSVHVDGILVVKSQHTLTLLQQGKPLRVYHISIGRGDGHAKKREGDHQTPEGRYVIDGRNERGHFHRALHISYPNLNDKKQAAEAGFSPGGDIMTHGIKNGLGWIGSLQRTVDWTDGCIAVTDSEIDEIWNLVPLGTQIEIIH